jgi:hypothetical protein
MLILKIWEKEAVSIDWQNSIICPIYRKGDQMQCKNYRPITLLNVAYKIFATILCSRLSEIMEGKLGEYQMGFRPNRSTVDNIFILRQMYEKCYEYNIELHNAFIDFNQAFDSINRKTVIKVLEEMQIPKKIVNLVNMVTQHTTAKIKLNNEYTEQIEVKTGIKQGDPLSTVLFCPVMESMIKKIRDKRKYNNRLETSLCLRRRYRAGIGLPSGHDVLQFPSVYESQTGLNGVIKCEELWCVFYDMAWRHVSMNDVLFGTVSSNQFRIL